MIAYLFLAVGASGTAAAAYFVAPAGHGLHRYVVPRSTLRADLARKERQVEELACRLTGALSELGSVEGERDRLRAELGKAEQLVTDAEGEASEHRRENRALKAALANANAIRPLVPVHALPPAPSTPVPSSTAVPLSQAPIAHRPAPEPT
ncbi:hypothetical protein KMT30_06655 [Streptomyces sp. IBSBF 2953]|nr:hypothetical protein [Streptomyces hayashii]